MPAPVSRHPSPTVSEAGVPLPDACALVAAVFAVAWPVAQALSGGGSTMAVAVPFALVLAFGFAFVGLLFGLVLSRLFARVGGVAVRLPVSVVALLAVVALVLGAWFGRMPGGD